MRIAVIGSGGREHALCWKLAQSCGPQNVWALPGNGGTLNNAAVDAMDPDAVLAVCRELAVDLVVVGPEAPLAAGLADHLRGAGLAVFGPGAAAARLESSKAFAKQFMLRHGVTTASHQTFDRPADAAACVRSRRGNVVIKYDGLAAGKGVFVCHDEAEALAALEQIAAAWGPDARVVVEERLSGPELSILALTDGRDILLLPPARDHKRLLDGDQGPNTGGMGAFCPVPGLDDALMTRVMTDIVQPTMNGLLADKLDYRGCLFFGLLLAADGPRLLEYNVRFGDPETEAVLPAVASDLADLAMACAVGKLGNRRIATGPESFVDVVVASRGYPGSVRSGLDISGLESAGQRGLLFHAGTRRQGDRVVTAGGRVLNVVGRGLSLAAAARDAYAAVADIAFEGMAYRTDIGRQTP